MTTTDCCQIDLSESIFALILSQEPESAPTVQPAAVPAAAAPEESNVSPESPVPTDFSESDRNSPETFPEWVFLPENSHSRETQRTGASRFLPFFQSDRYLGNYYPLSEIQSGDPEYVNMFAGEEELHNLVLNVIISVLEDVYPGKENIPPADSHEDGGAAEAAMGLTLPTAPSTWSTGGQYADDYFPGANATWVDTPATPPQLEASELWVSGDEELSFEDGGAPAMLRELAATTANIEEFLQLPHLYIEETDPPSYLMLDEATQTYGSLVELYSEILPTLTSDGQRIWQQITCTQHMLHQLYEGPASYAVQTYQENFEQWGGLGSRGATVLAGLTSALDSLETLVEEGQDELMEIEDEYW